MVLLSQAGIDPPTDLPVVLDIDHLVLNIAMLGPIDCPARTQNFQRLEVKCIRSAWMLSIRTFLSNVLSHPNLAIL